MKQLISEERRTETLSRPALMSGRRHRAVSITGAAAPSSAGAIVAGREHRARDSSSRASCRICSSSPWRSRWSSATASGTRRCSASTSRASRGPRPISSVPLLPPTQPGRSPRPSPSARPRAATSPARPCRSRRCACASPPTRRRRARRRTRSPRASGCRRRRSSGPMRCRIPSARSRPGRSCASRRPMACSTRCRGTTPSPRSPPSTGSNRPRSPATAERHRRAG